MKENPQKDAATLNNNELAASPQGDQKRPYTAPKLVSYGLVRNLTQAGSRGGVEKIGMGMMMKPMGMMGMG